MVLVKRVVLDVLKPHQPNSLEFATTIAEQTKDCKVKCIVTEVDEKTETVVIMIEGEDIRFDTIVDTITNVGGSLHSIDEVEVVAVTPPEEEK